MKFYNFFEKIQPDEYLIESNNSLYTVCDQLYEQFDLYRANMLREFHKILFDSSAEDYINPLFTIAACFRGMNYNTECDESSDNTPNQFTLYGDTISIAQWINDAYYQITSRDFIQDNVYASKVDLKQFKDDVKDKLHQIYCAIKERVERISNIELLEKRFANIFTSNIAGLILDYFIRRKK